MTTETYADTFAYGALAGRFASIGSADAYGGYEWDQIHVLRGADGYLYVGADSGCSCNSFGDHTTDPNEFVRCSSWQDAANQVRAWIEDYPDHRTAVGMQLIERLTNKQPAARIDIDPRQPWEVSS